jgi:hypothetical protein
MEIVALNTVGLTLVTKCEESIPLLAVASEEGQGPRRAVEPVMMMNTAVLCYECMFVQGDSRVPRSGVKVPVIRGVLKLCCHQLASLECRGDSQPQTAWRGPPSPCSRSGPA